MIFAFFLLIALYYGLESTADFFADFKWFESYNQLPIFWTLFYGKFIVALVFFLVFVALFALNFLLIRIIGGSGRGCSGPGGFLIPSWSASDSMGPRPGKRALRPWPGCVTSLRN
jgi:hypothetical protein